MSEQLRTLITVMGPQEARLTELYERYADDLLRYLHVLNVGNPESPEDLAQEVWIKVWNHIDHLHGVRVYGWIRRTAATVTIDAHRKRQCRPIIWFTDFLDTIDDNPVVSHLETTGWFSQLRPAVREMLVRRYLYRQTEDHIATAMSVPTGTVKSTIHYALKRLRREVAA